MASILRKKNKINISSKDLKKAVVNANNKLKKQNDTISSRIKEAEKLAKSKEKEVKSFEKQMDKRLKEMDIYDKSLTKIKAEIYSLEKQCSKLKKVITGLKREESSQSKALLKIEKVKDDLEEKIAEYEVRSQRAVKLTKDIDSLEIRKEVAQSDLNKLFKNQEIKNRDIESLKESFIKKKEEFEAKKDAARIESNGINLDLIDLKESFKKDKKEKDSIIKDLKEDISYQNEELSAVNSLINKAEDEYIAWQKKIENAKKDVEIEKRKSQTVKDALANWKINALEEVAKMKLKGKMENIDKAGLSEILGNG
jgi:predicted  nucleic acid-binding Zn-ribbon protein